VEYRDILEAFENLDFEYIDRNYNVNANRKQFIKAILLCMDGNYETAGKELYQLYVSLDESNLKSQVESILQIILSFQSKWKEIDLLDAKDPILSKSVLQELGKRPKVSYIFSEKMQSYKIELDGWSRPLVKVEINGHMKTFLLDTGYSVTTVQSDIAEEFNMEILSGDKIVGGTYLGRTMESSPAIIKELKIGDVIIRNQYVNVSDKKYDNPDWDGVIGWSIIQNLHLELDYRNRLMHIKKPIKKPVKNRNLFWLRQPFVKNYNEEGRELYFFLDTGAGLSEIYRKAIDKNNLDISKYKEQKDKLTDATGKSQYVNYYIIPEFRLIVDDYIIEFENLHLNIEPWYSKNMFFKYDGLLGSNVLRYGKITIDNLNGRFEFEK